MGISFFDQGDLQAVFLECFSQIFFWIGSKVCDVYIQNIRLADADLLDIRIAYF